MQRAFDWRLKLWLKFGTHGTSFRHFWVQCSNKFGVLPTCSHALQCNNLRVTLNVKYRQGPSIGAAPRSHTDGGTQATCRKPKNFEHLETLTACSEERPRGGEGRARTATQMINMSGVGSTIQNIMDEEMRSCHLLSESALLCADSLQPTVVQRNSGK